MGRKIVGDEMEDRKFDKNLLGLNCHEGDHAEHEIFHIVLRIAVIRVKELKL